MIELGCRLASAFRMDPAPARLGLRFFTQHTNPKVEESGRFGATDNGMSSRIILTRLTLSVFVRRLRLELADQRFRERCE